MGEVASSNLVVPTIYFQLATGGGHPKWVHGFEPGFVDFGFSAATFRIVGYTEVGMPYWREAGFTSKWITSGLPVIRPKLCHNLGEPV